MNAVHSLHRHVPLANAAITATLAVVAVMAFAGHAIADERPLAERPVPVIRVEGKGEVAAAPDMARLNLVVLREAKTARQALDADNKAMAAIIGAMKAEGIAGKDLQTSNFSIRPLYSPPPKAGKDSNGPPHIVGYTVSNALGVRVRDLGRLGAVLDKAVSLGVNSGGGIAFTNAEPDAFIGKARAAAVKDARARAETLAGAAGVKLGPILEISENYTSPRPVAMARSASFAEKMAVPVEAGESTYSVTVNVSWEILQ